ncbi:tetratricopeptide repeat protein [Gemmatimonadota bacterium]
MNGMGDDLLFASDTQALLREGRFEEAVQLGREGVEAHPHYATGHLILGIAHLDAGQYEEARLELEEARRLDGPGPALLDALTVCYDSLGLTDLAEECRILGEGHGLEPPRDEFEGGPEMAEERDDNLDPGNGELEQNVGFGSSFEIGDDAGSPEDALRELEALLEGAGSSLEGETIEEEPPVGDDLSIGEEPPSDASVSPDAEAPAGDDKSDLWKQILEQADADEQPDGLPVTAGGVIDLDAEPVDDAPVVEDAGVIDLDAEPVDDVPVVEDVGAIDLDSPLALDDVPDHETSVDMVEGLEVASPGGESIEIGQIEDLDTTGILSTDQDETVSFGGGEDLVTGPLELSDEMMDAASEGIELDTSFEVQPADDETASDEDLAGVHELSTVDGDELDIDEALKALEAELDTGSDMTDTDIGSLLEDDLAPTVEAPAEIGLDDSGTESLDLDQALADLEDNEDIDAVTSDEDISEEETGESPPEDVAVAATGISAAIANADDSVMVAIQAEILVGKGLYTEAVRLFEALQLWEPERESYRIRLEELRRMVQQPELPE